MNKRWMSITAGILDLINGVYLLYFTGVFSSIIAGAYIGHIYIAPFLFAILVIPATLAIVASIYALKRRKWGLVLAATIILLILPLPVLFPFAYEYSSNMTLLLNMPLAIAALVFLTLSKKDFERK